jgi:NhaP-type Na+/H+ or K+/H+ antiporter
LSDITFILYGLIIVLGFIGNYLFTKKSIPDNLILITFGVLLGPVLKITDPTGFTQIASVFSSLRTRTYITARAPFQAKNDQEQLTFLSIKGNQT